MKGIYFVHSPKKQDICVAQIYVGDIVFGTTNQHIADQFVQAVTGTFEMIMIGELTYSLGFQIQQKMNDLFLSQENYARNLMMCQIISLIFKVKGMNPKSLENT